MRPMGLTMYGLRLSSKGGGRRDVELCRCSWRDVVVCCWPRVAVVAVVVVVAVLALGVTVLSVGSGGDGVDDALVAPVSATVRSEGSN